MIVTRLFEPAIAQASYLVGCAATGEAIVIDPNRDIARYVEAAARENVRITHVTETHIHADFLSGARELARTTGATLLLSDEGDADWRYAFGNEARLIRHGDRIASRSMVLQQKTQRPVQFEITPSTREALEIWIKSAGLRHVIGPHRDWSNISDM